MTLFVHRNAGGRCPCGAADAACGPPSDVVPVGQDIEEVAAVSGPLKKYRVTRNGFETVMKLSDADAKKLGAGPYQVADGASTIEPVALAEDSGSEDGDGAADPDGVAAAMADTGSDVSPGMADGIPDPEPVQSPQDPGDGDGQAQGDAQAPADDGPQVQDTSAKAAAAKPARKRAASAPNKARTGAANKGDGGS